ncbi:MAG: putative exosortase B-associated extracellular polysaccharide biosynthesis transporter EpsL [Rhodocyclaceae bacterium]|nr:putative exosortase B-associated extracellular polysaccharide biosynthesis transporter EpsL [Rhodocyclaceae bacterium]
MPLSQPRFQHNVAPALAPALLLALLLAPTLATADAFDSLNLTVGATVMHDDNLFRLSSSADPQALLGTSQKSDTIRVTTLGLKFAKDYSLQRFELDASLVDYRYNTFDYLDFTAHNYSAAWRWALTPRLKGNFTRTRTEALNSFTDYNNYTQQNIRTSTNTRLDGDFELGAAVHIIAGASRSESVNSKIFLQEGDSTYDSADFGLRYVFRSGASVALVRRQGSGEYTNRPQPIAIGLYDNGFDQNDTELRINWPITAKTRLEGRIAHTEREHDHYEQRDYDGTIGNFSINWDVTAKTRVTASVSRELNSYQSVYSSYYQADRFVIAPYWQISAKTGLRLRYDYSQRDYLGAIAPTSYNDRTDTIKLGSIALEWAPFSNTLISASLQNEKRTSNKPGLDYESKMGTVSAQITF